MRKLLPLLLLVVLYSCQKEIDFAPPVITDYHPLKVTCFTHQLPILSKVRMQEILQGRYERMKKEKGDKPPKGKPTPPDVVVDTIAVPAAMLLIDFDGHYLEGTSWNSNGPLVLESSGLNASQMAYIVDSVRWDYKDFNVYVGTDTVLYAKVNPKRRMRVVLTDSWEWYGKAGGVAFTKSFTWGDNTPCFVFTGLHNYQLKNIHEATSHELGHTLGLRHQSLWVDSVKVNEYNSGVGNEAPIMGVSYSKPIGRWWVGLNPFGAVQDDEAIIRTYLY